MNLSSGRLPDLFLSVDQKRVGWVAWFLWKKKAVDTYFHIHMAAIST